MKIKKITTQELKDALENGEGLVLLDVLPPEYYASEHIKKALNTPVYEVAFLEHVANIVADKQRHIVVYNDNMESLSAQDAAEKLLEAGYESVDVFQGGLQQWKSAGLEIEMGEPIVQPIIQDGTYFLDAQERLVGWIGRNTKYAHRGKIMVKSGSFIFQDGVLKNGTVVMDMTSIQDEDLADQTWREILERHLKSRDFFQTEKYPEAALEITNAVLIAGVPVGVPNYKVTANLTVKDVTNEISFMAMIAPMGGGIVNGQAHFDFDRTLWNVRYGSEKFFEKLGTHLVNDTISMELFLVAKMTP